MTNSEINNNQDLINKQNRRAQKEFIDPLFGNISDVIKGGQNEFCFYPSNNSRAVEGKINYETKKILIDIGGANIHEENLNFKFKNDFKELDVNSLNIYIDQMIQGNNIYQFIKKEGNAYKIINNKDFFIEQDQIKETFNEKLQQINNMLEKRFNLNTDHIKNDFIIALFKNISNAIQKDVDVFEFYPSNNNRAVRGKINYETKKILIDIGGANVHEENLNFKFKNNFQELDNDFLKQYIIKMMNGSNVYNSIKETKDSYLFICMNEITELNYMNDYLEEKLKNIKKSFNQEHSNNFIIDNSNIVSSSRENEIS